MSLIEWIVLLWLGTSAGAVVMFAWASARTRRWEQQAKRDRMELARLHGIVAGRVMRQMGQPCPRAVSGHDEDAAHRNAMVAGWHEVNDEILEAERWTADGIEDVLETWRGAG